MTGAWESWERWAAVGCWRQGKQVQKQTHCAGAEGPKLLHGS